MQFIINTVQTKIERLFVILSVIEISFKICLVNIIGKPKPIYGVRVAAHVILIIIYTGRNKRIKFVIINMFPLYHYIFITIFVGGIHIESEIIIAQVSRQV